jgi:nicotinamidase-related amidase
VINDLEFEGGEELLTEALRMAERLAELKARAAAAAVPVIYVNDNFGRWRSDFKQHVRHCLEDGVRGEPIARRLAPAKDDYFVLKPHNSAFHETALSTLLQYLGVHTLVLTGMACNICVLFTANDAHMRGYEVVAPLDCVASEKAADTKHALELMRDALGARVVKGRELNFGRLGASDKGVGCRTDP